VPRAPRIALASLVATTLGLAACGQERAPVPDAGVPQDPRAMRPLAFPAAGVAFTGPTNWRVLAPGDPLKGGIESGRATLAIWRYPRTEPLPNGRAELRRVRGLLVERVKARDPSFVLDRSRVTRRGGAAAVELTGQQTINGSPVRVRSSHVYFEGAELVLDAYAAPGDFPRVDAAVFGPALRSLKLSAPTA
jgi:hypothetical protein